MSVFIFVKNIDRSKELFPQVIAVNRLLLKLSTVDLVLKDVQNHPWGWNDQSLGLLRHCNTLSLDRAPLPHGIIRSTL